MRRPSKYSPVNYRSRFSGNSLGDRMRCINYFHSQHEQSMKKHMHHSIFLHQSNVCGGEVNQVKLFGGRVNSYSPGILSIPFSAKALGDRTRCIDYFNSQHEESMKKRANPSFHISAQNVGGKLTKWSFRRLSKQLFTWNIIDRGFPQKHLAITCVKWIIPTHNTSNQLRNACIILYFCIKYGGSKSSEVIPSEAK